MKSTGAFVAHLAEVFRSFGDETLYLKVDAETHLSFARPGSVPFTYVNNGKAMAMSYHSAPAEIFDDADAARSWDTLAYGATLRSKQATKPQSSPRSKPRAARRPA